MVLSEHDQLVELTARDKMEKTCGFTRKHIICLIAAVIVAFCLGIPVGWFGRPTPDVPDQRHDGVFLKGAPKRIISEADPRIEDLLMNEIKADNIREFHRNLTWSPNLAGTEADLRKARYMEQWWKKQGLDESYIMEYDVLLSYPNKTDTNLISLLAGDGSVTFSTNTSEPPRRPDDIHPNDDVVPPFNSYSPPGDVTSNKFYYVNYGREEDFHWMANNISGVDFKDSIVIARYGKIFRANKVFLAARYGCKAIFFYSDPYDYSSPTANSSYPDSWWLPDTGVQRGTVKLRDGDPLTPFYPATKSAYRLSESDNDTSLPPIPAHPMSSKDAQQLLSVMSGNEVPESWRGSIDGLSYKFGGVLPNNQQIEAHITTHHERKKTYTVIGVIRGAVEPDRYVLLGNHRDGWVYGALDPLSGTAAMLETSRALTSIMKSHDWRPRRTIIFCSWAAEEYGLVGSYEWVEHFSRVLSQRAVAYLNVDILIEGIDSIRFKATPMTHDIIYKTAKKVKNPSDKEISAGRKTVFDTWLHVTPRKDDPTKPKMRLVGSGSDYTSLLQVLGIPCLEPRYTYDSNKYKLSSYPTYHSVYETFYLVDSIMDPGFKISRAITQVWADLVRSFSDEMILPLSAGSMGRFIKSESETILSAYETLMKNNNMAQDIDYFREAVDKFLTNANEFEINLQSINKNNPYAVRQVNDQLMNLHRGFIDPLGLPDRPFYRNLLSAPSQFDSYAGSVFPSLTDSLYRIEDDPDKAARWSSVRKILSVITYTVETTATTLKQSTQFCDGLNFPSN